MKRDVEKDREMCEKATKGPWVLLPPLCGPQGQGVFHQESGGLICEVGDPYPRGDNKPQENMEFIAEARTALPYYIDRTETATKLLKRVGHMQKVRVTGDEEAEAWGSDWDELVERIREFLGEEERHDL